jgi:hypothetical protein
MTEFKIGGPDAVLDLRGQDVSRGDAATGRSRELQTSQRKGNQNVTLWDAYTAAGDAYTAACHAHHKAARVVLSNLRKQALSTSVLPTPTSDEIQALAYFYVRDRLRASRQINMTICALAGVTKTQIESAWGLRDLRDSIEPTQEMVKVLHSKGLVSFEFFMLTRSGEEQCLHAAEINNDKKED